MYFVCINFVISVRLYCFVLCMYQFCHLSEVVLFCTLYVSILSSQWGCIVLYFVCINFVILVRLYCFVLCMFISVRLYCFVLCMYQFCHLSELYCFVIVLYFVCINFVILVRLYCFVLCMYQLFCEVVLLSWHLSEVVLFCTLCINFVCIVLYFVCINFVISVRLYCFVLCMYQFCHLSEVVLFCTLYVSILSSQLVVLFCTLYVSILSSQWGCIVLYFVCINFVISVRLYCFVLCMYQFCHLSEVVLFCTLYVSILSS